MNQKMKPDLIPGGDPNDPARHKPPGLASLSLADLESAEHLLNPEPDGEAESESEFATKLREATERAIPGDETLKAMEK